MLIKTKEEAMATVTGIIRGCCGISTVILDDGELAFTAKTAEIEKSGLNQGAELEGEIEFWHLCLSYNNICLASLKF